MDKTKLSKAEMEQWKAVADNMYFPFDKERNIYLQQDGFLDRGR
jgi:maltose phosphorylase